MGQPQLQAAALGSQTATRTGTIGQTSSNPLLNAGPIAPGQSSTADNATTQPAGLASGASQQPSAGTTADASPVADEKPKTDCDLSQSKLYCVYEVQPGDTLSAIATRYGLKPSDSSDLTSWQLLVLSNKPDITSEDDLLQPGQHLRIPLHNGVVHTVLNADTLSDIASEYGVTVEDITAVNPLANANDIGIGSELLIPNPQRYSAPVSEAASAPASGSGGGSDAAGASSSGSSSGSGSGAGTVVGSGPKSNVGFIWPVSGPISSYFGPAHPLGIDIDLFNHHHAAIAAVAGGVVTFAGGNACCSYGLYVVIDHGNGYQTLYAHLSSISVSVGQVVAQGQQVGISGVTGYSTGEHLHFEVHKNGAVVNPLSYLP